MRKNILAFYNIFPFFRNILGHQIFVFFRDFFQFLYFRDRHETQIYASDLNNFGTDRKLGISAFDRCHSRLLTRSKKQLLDRFEISTF